jgi:hypothetical protein
MTVLMNVGLIKVLQAYLPRVLDAEAVLGLMQSISPQYLLRTTMYWGLLHYEQH